MASPLGTPTPITAIFSTFYPNNKYRIYKGSNTSTSGGQTYIGPFSGNMISIASYGPFTYGGSTITTGFKLSGLIPGTTYNDFMLYEVLDNGFEQIRGGIGTFTTAPMPFGATLTPLASRSDSTLVYDISGLTVTENVGGQNWSTDCSAPSGISGLQVYSKDSAGNYQLVNGPIGSYNSTTKKYTITGLSPYVAYKVNFNASGAHQGKTVTFESKSLVDQYTKTVADAITVTQASTATQKAATVIDARNIIKNIVDPSTKVAQQATYISTLRTALGVASNQTGTYSVTDATQKSSLISTLNNGASTAIVKSEIVGVLPAFSGTSATVDVASYDVNKSYLFEVPIGYVLTLKNGAATLALTYNGTQFTGTGGPYGVNSNVNVGGKVFKLWGFGSAGVNPLSTDVTVSSVVVDGQTVTPTTPNGQTYNQVRTTAFKTDMEITVTPTHPNAKPYITKPAQFVAEDNTVTFEVTAEDTITKRTYTIPVWVKPDYLPCFPEGTRVMVQGGYKAVEDLKTSDLIVTSDGRQVSFKRYKTHVAKANKDTAPYLVKAGAFGRAQPPNDVRLSGLHAIQSRKGVWQIPQYAALSNDKVVQYGLGEPVTYYHIELPNFFTDNLIVEGAVCESYAGQQADHVKTVYNYNGNLNGFSRVSAKPATKSASK